MVRWKLPRVVLWKLVLFWICAQPARTQAGGVRVYSDPVGDTFGVGTVQQDITQIASNLTATDLTFTVTFADPIFAPSAADARSVVGFLDIDLDRNPATGVTDADSNFAIARGIAAKSGLGVESFFDLFSEINTPGSVDLVDAASLSVIGSAPISFDAKSFSITVSLAVLGGDGLVNYGVIAGTFQEATDEARNPGLPPATTAGVPEPSSLALLAGSIGCLVIVWPLRRCIVRPRAVLGGPAPQ
jgi:hypothetical protein